MSNFEGYIDNKTILANFTVPSAAMRSGDFSALATPLLDPATCTVAGGVRACQAVSGQSHTRQPDPSDFAAAARVLSGAERRRHGNELRLARQDREIDRKQYTSRFDFVQGSKSNWMGRYSWGHDDEVSPALMLNGSKLLNTVHQVMVGNTYTLAPTVLNEFRFGFNSFFNTFGRELAFERDVVNELDIPGVSTGPPEAWGIPTIGISGMSGFGDSTEGTLHQPEQGVRVHRQPVVDPRPALVQGRRRASGSTTTTRSATSSRAVRSRSTDERQDRRRASRRRARAAFADFLLGYMRSSESAVALASTDVPRRPARRTTSRIRGACATT